MYRVYGFAVAPYIDRNGLPHTPQIKVSPVMRDMVDDGAPILQELMEAITGKEYELVNVAAMIASHYHEMDDNEAVGLLEKLEEEDEFEQAPEFYVVVGDDEDDLEDLLIGLVGEPEEDELDLDLEDIDPDDSSID